MKKLGAGVLLIVLSGFLLPATADEYSADIDQSLKLAGGNSQQIQTALDKVPSAQREGMRFLIANMPERDLQQLSADFLLEHTDYAYRAWNESPWKPAVPKEIFLDYILPYSSIDERRDRWRKDFYERFKPLVEGADTPGKAGVLLNQKLWKLLNVRFSTARPKANQSPYETIEAQMASCTGLSVLLVDACRAVGVPARFVGTPLWSDKSGNHSWVEIWDQGDWNYTGAAEPAGDRLNEVWFGGRAAAAVTEDPIHAIYAMRFQKSPVMFPLLWSSEPGYAYAVNVTERYKRRNAKPGEGEVVARFRVIDKADRKRRVATLKLTDGAGKVLLEGKSRDEGFDPNDHLEVFVPRNSELRVEVREAQRSAATNIRTPKDEELFTLELE